MHIPNFFVNEEGDHFVIIHNMTVPCKATRYPMEKTARAQFAEKVAMETVQSVLPVLPGMYTGWSGYVKGVYSEPDTYRLCLTAKFSMYDYSWDVTVVINPLFPDSIQVQIPETTRRLGNTKGSKLREWVEKQVSTELEKLHSCFSFAARLKK